MERPDSKDSSAESAEESSAPYYNGESELVVVETKPGASYVGRVISDGPGVLRLMMTRPFNSQGRIVEIPLEEVEVRNPLPQEEE